MEFARRISGGTGRRTNRLNDDDLRDRSLHTHRQTQLLVFSAVRHLHRIPDNCPNKFADQARKIILTSRRLFAQHHGLIAQRAEGGIWPRAAYRRGLGQKTFT